MDAGLPGPHQQSKGAQAVSDESLEDRLVPDGTPLLVVTDKGTFPYVLGSWFEPNDDGPWHVQGVIIDGIEQPLHVNGNPLWPGDEFHVLDVPGITVGDLKRRPR
jgi:hypothetical protein